MKALVRVKAGKEFSGMRVQELPSPQPGPDQLLVKMKASRINPVDMDLMKGFPTLKYKNPQVGGVDGAGKVMAVGSNVGDFAVGDAVFFYRKFTDIGSWAEEVTVSAKDVAIIPEGIGLEEAGSIALPVLTAFDALLSLKGQTDETILIHGAGGGVGFMAVQLARQLGLKVIANAGQRDFEALQSVGVDQIIDYKTQDFFEELKASPPDYVFDVIGKETLLKSIRLKPKKVVSVAYPEVDEMYKTGVALPGFMKWLMKFMGKKYRAEAKRNGVVLIGQVTGPSGELMTQAVTLANAIQLQVRPIRTVDLDTIASNGMTKADLGKTIIIGNE